MKSGSNIISAIQHLRMADDNLLSFINDNKGTKGAALFQSYRAKIAFIFRDLITHPFLTDEVRQGIKNEIASDVYAVPALFEKIPLLPPEQREYVELIVDDILAGRELKIVNDTIETI